jgi:hypothetical protein
MPDPVVALHALCDFWFGAPDPENPVAGAAVHGEPLLAAPTSLYSPTEGEDPLPWAQIYAVGGSGGPLENDTTVDVQFFASKYGDASLLARRFDARIMGYPHRVSSNGRSVLFDRVETVSTPVEIDWDQGATRRFQATYSLSIRR